MKLRRSWITWLVVRFANTPLEYSQTWSCLLLGIIKKCWRTIEISNCRVIKTLILVRVQVPYWALPLPSFHRTGPSHLGLLCSSKGNDFFFFFSRACARSLVATFILPLLDFRSIHSKHFRQRKFRLKVKMA